MRLFILLILASCATIKQDNKVPELPIEEVIVINTPAGEVITASNLAWVKELAKVATCVKNSKGFLDEVASTPMLDTQGSTQKEVADMIKAKTSKVSVYSYFNPFSDVIAYADMNNDTVKLRSQMNPRAMSKMVNTVIHETTHLIGFRHDRNGNYATGDNLKTVPYMAGAIAEKHLRGCE